MAETEPDWKAEYPKFAKYTPEEWEEYSTNPAGWCIKALGNSDSSVRYNAVDILRGLCPDAEIAIGPLAMTLGDSDAEVRAHTAFALIDFAHRFKNQMTVAIEPLIQTLGDPDSETRSLAAQALGLIGSAAKAALPALTELESDPDEEVRDAVGTAIEAIGAAS